VGRDGQEERVTPYTSEAQALFEASGEVKDVRRLVAYLYLILRDEFAFGAVEDAARLSAVGADPASPVARDRAYRLHDKPSRRLRVFLHLLQQPDATWAAYDGTLPLRDDIITNFSNGWVARYAQHTADLLTREDVS